MNNIAEKEFLRNYDKDKYEKPSVTVDVCICRIKDCELQVLLIKRKRPPFQDCWAIPGGFVDLMPGKEDPTLEYAAKRELMEETSLKNVPVYQLATYGDAGRDPRMRVISVAYFSIVNDELMANEKIEAADDARDARWWNLRELPSLAFDHKMILSDLLVRIQGRIQYSAIAFEFLPKRFTWKDLQNVFEIILDKKLVPTNFRRKIQASYDINELDESKSQMAGRPARLLQLMGVKDVY